MALPGGIGCDGMAAAEKPRHEILDIEEREAAPTCRGNSDTVCSLVRCIFAMFPLTNKFRRMRRSNRLNSVKYNMLPSHPRSTMNKGWFPATMSWAAARELLLRSRIVIITKQGKAASAPKPVVSCKSDRPTWAAWEDLRY